MLIKSRDWCKEFIQVFWKWWNAEECGECRCCELHKKKN
jgi:hypothetical protein